MIYGDKNQIRKPSRKILVQISNLMILKQKLQAMLHKDMVKDLENLNKGLKIVLLFVSYLLPEDMQIPIGAQDIMATHQDLTVLNNPKMHRNLTEHPIIRGKTQDA